MDNMKRNFSKVLFATSFLLPLLLVLSGSCKKTSPADANVKVVDSLSRPVKGALVILRQDTVVNPSTGVQADIYDEKTTDINGNAFFSFKWEAVLNVEVTKGNLKAYDYIRLEQSNTVSKTIILK